MPYKYFQNVFLHKEESASAIVYPCACALSEMLLGRLSTYCQIILVTDVLVMPGEAVKTVSSKTGIVLERTECFYKCPSQKVYTLYITLSLLSGYICKALWF